MTISNTRASGDVRRGIDGPPDSVPLRGARRAALRLHRAADAAATGSCATAAAADRDIVVTGAARPIWRRRRPARRPRPTPTSSNIPQALTIVSASQIEDQQLRSVADLLTFVPGASYGTGEGNRDTDRLARQFEHRRLLRRRGARRRPVFPRLLQRRPRRGAQGPERDDLRPRRRRRDRQPRAQAAELQRRPRAAGVGRRLGRHRLTGDVDQPLGDSVGVRLNGALRGRRQLPPPRRPEALRHQPDRRRCSPGPTRGSTSATNISTTAAPPTAAFPPTATSRSAASRAPSSAIPTTATPRPTSTSRRSAVEHEFGDGLTLRNRTMFGDYDKFYQNIFANSACSTHGDAARARHARRATTIATTARTCSARPISSGRTGSPASTRRCCSASRSAARSRATCATTGTLRRRLATIGAADRSDGRRDVDLRADRRATRTTASRRRSPRLTSRTRSGPPNGSRSSPACASTASRSTSTISAPSAAASSAAATISGRRASAWSSSRPTTVALRQLQPLLPAAVGRPVQRPRPTSPKALKPERFDNYEIGAKWELARRAARDRGRLPARPQPTPARPIPIDPDAHRADRRAAQPRLELGLERSVTSRWLISAGYALQKAEITETTTAAPDGPRSAAGAAPQLLAVEPLRRDRAARRWALA